MMAERRRPGRLRGAVLLLLARWVGADGGGHVDVGTPILTLGQYLDKRVVHVWIGEQMVALAVAMNPLVPDVGMADTNVHYFDNKFVK